MTALIASIDHVVLTTADVQAATRFYCDLLGMQPVRFGTAGLLAFKFGTQKFNVQERGREASLRSAKPTPGALDICFLAGVPLQQVIERLQQAGVTIECGPVLRTGGCGPMRSIYVRDPDDNLVEIAEPLPAAAGAAQT